MIPRPQQPRNERMKLLASALCTRTIADAKPILQNNGHVVLEVRLEGHSYGKPRVAIPRSVFVSTWNNLLGREMGFIYINSQIRDSHGKELLQEIKGRGCVVRIQHYRMDGDRDLWSHEVMEVYP